jgi:hypothetical protein
MIPVLVLTGVLACLSCTATPKSGDSARAWTAGASLYSGRVDPSWQVKQDAASALVRCIEQLGPAAEVGIPEPPGLGYRGSWLRAPDGREWKLFGGAVQTDTTRLSDRGRNCERKILETAPAGLLPGRLLP